MTLERAEAWHLECPLSGARFLVQFWDTHREDRMGRRRMAWAVFEASAMLPSNYRLARHGNDFWPSPLVSCDGAEAAKHLMGFLTADGFFGDDILADELEATHASEIGEHHLLMGR